MSGFDGIKLDGPKAGYSRTHFQDHEAEDAGLLNTQVEPEHDGVGTEYDDEAGLVPVMLENYLERQGIMAKLRPYLLPTGQIKHVFARQLVAEFMGTMLFQLFGGAAPPEGAVAAPANGFALVAVVYAFANVSGAHLNPAVSFALMLTGHQKWWQSLSYMVMQILGAIFGSMIYAALIPGLHIAHKSFQGGNAPGCFGPAKGVSGGEVFGWEMMMTFLLVCTVYAAAVAKPGHGNTAPLAIGLALYAAALTGGPYTGASLNPARTIGPACTFACNGGVSVLYIVAELFGAACASGLAVFMYGVAPSKSQAIAAAAARGSAPRT